MSVKFYGWHGGGYEELASYYPRFYRGVLEMEAVLKYFGEVCDDMQAKIEQAFLNNFILQADEETVREWEGFLEIRHDKPLSLDQRRRVILGRISGTGHIGEPEIRAIVSIYTDCDITVDFEGGVIRVDIDGEIFDEGSLYQSLLNRIPAHLALKMTARTIRKFPMELKFGFGAATGQESLARPLAGKREERRQAGLSCGGFAISSGRLGPAAAARRSEERLAMPRGAAMGRESGHGPLSKPREAKEGMPLSAGGYQRGSASAIPIGADRSSRMDMALSGAGALGAEQKDPHVAMDRSGKSAARESNGFFCRTHISTKRAKEDD